MKPIQIKVNTLLDIPKIQKALFKMGYDWESYKGQVRLVERAKWFVTTEKGGILWASEEHRYEDRENYVLKGDKLVSLSSCIHYTTTSLKPIITMKANKTEKLKVNGKNRDITVAGVITEDGELRVGYSVRLPSDKKYEELALKIATGRAMSDKTNLVDMTVGIGMDKKYIIYAVLEHVLRQIGRGTIAIKGIK